MRHHDGGFIPSRMTRSALKLLGEPACPTTPREIRKNEPRRLLTVDLGDRMADGLDVGRIMMRVGDHRPCDAVLAETPRDPFNEGRRRRRRGVYGAGESRRKRRGRDRQNREQQHLETASR